MTHEPANIPPTGVSRPARDAGGRRGRSGRGRLALGRLSPPRVTPPSRKTMAWVAATLALLAALVAILVAIWDWNWFRGPVERYASARLHREVTIVGDLDADIWSWRPSASVEGLRIANPAWAGGGQMGGVERLDVRVRLLPLLWGRLDIRLLKLQRPRAELVVDGRGRRNWDFSDGRRPAPVNLPAIGAFIIEDGRVGYRDRRRDLRFQGVLNASERRGAENRGFQLAGAGAIGGAPFRAEVTGGPLLNIQRDRPYPFDVDMRVGQTRLTAHGAIPRPFDLGHLRMSATARGPDMADLFPVTGVALPNTPPYSLRGRLYRDGLVWRVEDLGGRVGDSDLSGDLSVRTGGPRPMLTAKLRSQSLDFDDLGALFGAAPKTGAGETASPTQVAIARQLVAQQRLFPDATLDVSRIRAMDADVTYEARSIRDAPVSLSSGSVRVRLEDGLLRANPLTAELPRGKVEGYVNLDARKATPVTDLDLRLTNGRIEQMVPARGGAPPLAGVVMGRARLTGAGDSVHKAFANADGQVTVVVPGGEIRKAFAELMGVNVVKGLGLLASKDTSTTPIRCAVADFRTDKGVMRADSIVLDTGPVLVTGAGAVNLATERMDIRLRGHDKKFRLVRVLLPITAKGPLMAPRFGVDAGSAVAQGGVAAALGTLLSPLAGILPFIDPGLAKDANCGALLAEARGDGVPVARAAKPLTARR